jgi:predicted RNA-binding Zn-ribbon protein involved in translation (DUF1610 family)
MDYSALCENFALFAVKIFYRKVCKENMQSVKIKIINCPTGHKKDRKMGYKLVCLDCRKSFSAGTDLTKLKEKLCPNCGKMMICVSHLFKPPKKDDKKQWDMVRYLIENGFRFYHAYKYVKQGTWIRIPYPENLREAKEFVTKYEKHENSSVYLIERKENE